MRSACYLLLAAALAASASCTTPDAIPDVQGSSFVDTDVAANSLRNSIFDDCGWAAEISSLRNLVPGISVGRDGFQRITNAICAAARSKPAPAFPGDSVTFEVEGTLVRGRFLEPGETLGAAPN